MDAAHGRSHRGDHADQSEHARTFRGARPRHRRVRPRQRRAGVLRRREHERLRWALSAWEKWGWRSCCTSICTRLSRRRMAEAVRGPGRYASTKRLVPFLPVPRVMEKDGVYSLSEDFPQSIGKLHAFQGNFGVMARAHAYIRTMGAENLKKASEFSLSSTRTTSARACATSAPALRHPPLYARVRLFRQVPAAAWSQHPGHGQTPD